MRKFIFILGAFSLLVGCSGQDSWNAFYYPDKDAPENFTKQSGFIDAEACAEYLLNLSDSIDRPSSSLIQCGKNCDFNLDLERFVCEEIF